MDMRGSALSATARLVVQMTPKEKQALDERARRAGVTTSEFVRRRISDDDLDEHRDEIEAFLTAIEAAGPSILRQLDAATATAESATASIKSLDATPSEPARAFK